jgi:Mlc titration factor MtfA (ptsG expression regulator)
MFQWLKKRRRQNLLATPVPEAWLEYLEQVAFFHLLSSAEQERLLEAVRIFIAEKSWEGCRGLVLTEEMQVMVAGLACVLVLGLEDFYFDNVQTILIYPGAFVRRDKKPLMGDLYLEGPSELLGEAHYRGPVILAWDEVQASARQPGHGSNLVLHEFAHQLDMLNGEADGVPLLSGELTERWQTIMGREFQHLVRRVAKDRPTFLDPYGATNPAEFFAVVTECFFDVPLRLQEEHPDLYGLLRDYYRQDPATWAQDLD